MRRLNWVKLPTGWIINNGLKKLSWKNGQGSNNTAALMVLPVLAHYADQDTGETHVTYDTMCEATGLSRTKVSDGLKVLLKHCIIESHPKKKSLYRLESFDPSRGWAKLPNKSLYKFDQIDAFTDFHLRRSTELNALKLYFLFIALRDNNSNLTKVNFDKISGYTGIARNFIKPAQSVLASHSLVFVERMPSEINAFGISNVYRIAGIDPYRHRGTTGRSELAPEEL